MTIIGAPQCRQTKLGKTPAWVSSGCVVTAGTTFNSARIEKHYRDAFEDTDLERMLSTLGVGKLIVTGAQTDMCIRSTLHGALVRGYDATLVSDAHTTEDMTQWGAPPPDGVIAHTNLYRSNQRAPGRAGRIVASKDVNLGLSPADEGRTK